MASVIVRAYTELLKPSIIFTEHILLWLKIIVEDGLNTRKILYIKTKAK